MEAWYFSNLDKRLRNRDGRKIEVGITHRVLSKPHVCVVGLHGSIRVIDALKFAPGPYIWRVNITGDIDSETDKFCGRRRQYLWGLDATDILYDFARKQALINIHKIEPFTAKFSLIVEFLTTGERKLRSAAESAARSAAWLAARSAAESSAESAARLAAESAARSSAGSAARLAAESAADDMLTDMIIQKHLKDIK